MSFLIWAPRRPQPLRCHLLLYVNMPIVFQRPSVVFVSQYIVEKRVKERRVVKQPRATVIWKWNISAGLWRGGNFPLEGKTADNWAGERRGGEKQKGKQGEGENEGTGIDWAYVWAAPHMSGDLTLTQHLSRWSESCTETCGSEANSHIPMDGRRMDGWMRRRQISGGRNHKMTMGM